ncbi:Crp/Fnr family transcriptional regulator [Hyphococcus sp.]|uniref:Crp/Fnr family transcriptional regulator n=1 Tax=Hyphococcus sp. TaxID=2038636 RepID=UPI002086C18A|nr:MAG: Crp/Fnr family transcriptional regulator [Marinicaulis sp.]
MKNAAAGLIWELKRHPFFEALSDDKLKGLLDSAQSVVFAGRKQIFAQGDDSDCLYIILSGRVKISSFSDAGKETVLAFMGENEVLGEMGVFDGGARSASASALQETRALRLYRRDVLDFLERNHGVALQIISALCQRLRHTNFLLEDIATLPAGPRLARALLRLGDHYGHTDADGAMHIDMKLSQGNLGAHAGLMRENVNRQLKLWEAEGLVKQEGGVITVLKPETLSHIGDE